MRKLAMALTAVAALATTAVVNSPAEARGGRNAAIGFGSVSYTHLTLPTNREV